MKREAGIRGEDIAAAARAWVGRPFRHQGRSEHGVDCVGLVIMVRASFGGFAIDRAGPADYRRQPDGRLLEAVRKLCTPIEKPEAGCMAVIAWPRQRDPYHVAILTPATIVHAYASAARVVETGYAGIWVRQTHSLYRLPGVIAP